MPESYRPIPDDFFEKKNSVYEIDKNWKTIYRKKLGEYKRLTREEEVELSKLIHGEDPKASEEAKERFIGSNLPLVVKIATKFARTARYAEAEQIIGDLIQEGSLGMINALEKFDPSLGYKFSTYATPWIKQYITVFLNNKLNPMKSTGSVSWHKEHEFVTVDEALDRTEKTSTVLEKLTSKNLSPEEAAEKNEIKKIIQEAINSLPKERDRIIAKEHLLGDKTGEEVGKMFGVSASRILYLEAKIKKKLKEYLKEKGIKNSL